jgi:DNA-binding CsgD family transcriptional regulator
VQFQRPRQADLAECAELLEERFLYSDAEIPDLIRFWTESLAAGIAYTSMVTDEAYPTPLAFGISALVDDAQAERFLSYATPRIGREIFDRWRSGASPLLDEHAIGRANASDGVNIVVMASGWTHVDALRMGASFKLIEGFMDAHLGLYLRTFCHEIFGEPPFPPEALSMRVDRSTPEIGTPSGREPLLISTRRDAQTADNFTAQQLFHRWDAPRFRFDARARMLLRLALDGFSDDEIAAAIALSPNGVKKRWQNIFDIVRDRSKLLDGAEPTEQGKRGAEIRRIILNYVRSNRQELHPYVSDAGISATLRAEEYSRASAGRSPARR